MTRYRSMAQLFDEDSPVAALLLDMLWETEAMEPWRWIRDRAQEVRDRRLAYELRKQRLEKLKDHPFTLKEVANAAGARLTLIRKYVKSGVRGSGKLLTDEEGNVTLSYLSYFASLHRGRAKDVALIAVDRLCREPIHRPHSVRRTKNVTRPTISVGQERCNVKANA